MFLNWILLSVFVLASSALLVGLFWSRRRTNKSASLRGLFIVMTLVALILGGILAYRRRAMAQMQILDAAASAKIVPPAPTIRQRDDGEFEVHYVARSRSIQKLLKNLRVGQGGYTVHNQDITIHSEERSYVESARDVLLEDDQLPQGSMVLRGVVRDRAGKPVPNATVDIMGKFVFINCFRTRENGTFTMAITDRNSMVPAGFGYYLRIRTAGETHRWNTGYFSLNLDQPEMDLVIVVPQ